MSDYLMSNETFFQPEVSPPATPFNIFLFIFNKAEAEELAGQLNYYGYQTKIFTDHTVLNKSLRMTTPKAMVVVLENGHVDFKDLHNLTRLATRQANPVPLLVVSKDDNIEVRLRAVQAGASAFFSYPVDAGALVVAVDEFSNPEQRVPYRIMIIGETISQASYYAMHIERVGMQTRIVTDLPTLVQPLVEFNPDLILMERSLSECSGYDLAQVIHQMDNFVSVPVVYLSSENGEDGKLESTAIGGDYLLTKPVNPNHLVAVVTSRVQRYRKLRMMMINDGLTGLLNHTTTKERLDNEILRASREKKQLAYAMIDLDDFKQLNDMYGHGTGDRVLKSFARLFKQRLRRTDLVGRNGGDEFAVIMPNTSADEAASVMDHLREGFANVHHRTADATFSLTFSCGVAAFPEYDSAKEIATAADKAMYQAKRRGRNRVITARHIDEQQMMTNLKE